MEMSELEKTGFDQGDEFSDASQVYEYFTVQRMNEMFNESVWAQDELDEMAEYVIEYKIHCAW